MKFVSECTVGVKPSILVVDDEEMNRFLFALRLEELNLLCDCAGDGEGALRAVEEKDYDLIFLDCNMPGMDGFTLAALIRQRESGRGRRAVIVAVTADEDSPERRLEAGMDQYLSKSCTLPQIDAIVGKWRGRAEHEIVRRMTEFAGAEPLRKLTAQFLQRAEDELRSLAAALRQGDWEKAEGDVHRMKGKAAMFGAVALAAVIGQLEQAVRRRVSNCEAVIASAMEELRAFQERHGG